MEAMSEREAWAFGVFAKAAATQKAVEHNSGEQLEEWLDQSTGKGWFTETAEAK